MMINIFLFLFLVRLYDVRTSQCFVSDTPGDQHKGPITMVEYYFVLLEKTFFAEH